MTVDIDLELLDEAVRQTGANSRSAALEAGLRLLLERAALDRLAGTFGSVPEARGPRRRRS